MEILPALAPLLLVMLVALVFVVFVVASRITVPRWEQASEQVEAAITYAQSLPEKANLRIDVHGDVVYIENKGKVPAVDIRPSIFCEGDQNDYFASLTDHSRSYLSKTHELPAETGIQIPWLTRKTAPAMLSLSYRTEGSDEVLMAHASTGAQV